MARVTPDDLDRVADLYRAFDALTTRACSFEYWIALKLSCPTRRARALADAFWRANGGFDDAPRGGGF